MEYLKLEDIVQSNNLADDLDEEWLSNISRRVIEGCEEDHASRREWLVDAEEIIKLAELKYEKVSDPWENASNVKYPLIATAVVQWMSRISGNIVRNGRIVEAKVVGLDMDPSVDQKAEGIAGHMSYQLLESPNTDWEDENDRCLYVAGLLGLAFKKTWFDPVKNINRSEACKYDEIIVNDSVSNLEHAYRITHKFKLTRNKIEEFVRLGMYCEFEAPMTAGGSPEDVYAGVYEGNGEEFTLLEQHTYYDLDGDGYEEPYIATVCKETEQVMRVVARFTEDDVKRNADKDIYDINPQKHFTDYHFFPNPMGSYHSVGLGQFLLATNKAINLVFNQLINSGTLYNSNSGIMAKGLRRQAGPMRLRQGEFWQAEAATGQSIKDSIMLIPTHEPSNVLFQLLGLLIQSGKELTATTDAMSGNVDPQYAKAGAVSQIIQQGMTVFNSIQKRLFRSYKREFYKLFRLNSIYLHGDQDQIILCARFGITPNDYDLKNYNICAVADPDESEFTKRAQQNQELLQVLQIPGMQKAASAILLQFITNSDLTNKNQIIQALQQPDPPNPETQKLQHDMQMKEMELQLKAQEVQIKALMAQNDAISAKAGAMKDVATGEAQLQQVSVDKFKALADHVEGLQDLAIKSSKPESKGD